MAVSFSISVDRNLTGPDGLGKKRVFAEVTASGTVTTGGDALSSANLSTLGLRNIDYVRIVNGGFLDATNKRLYLAAYDRTSGKFLFFKDADGTVDYFAEWDSGSVAGTAECEIVGS